MHRITQSINQYNLQSGVGSQTWGRSLLEPMLHAVVEHFGELIWLLRREERHLANRQPSISSTD